MCRSCIPTYQRRSYTLPSVRSNATNLTTRQHLADELVHVHRHFRDVLSTYNIHVRRLQHHTGTKCHYCATVLAVSRYKHSSIVFFTISGSNSKAVRTAHTANVLSCNSGGQSRTYKQLTLCSLKAKRQTPTPPNDYTTVFGARQHSTVQCYKLTLSGRLH